MVSPETIESIVISATAIGSGVTAIGFTLKKFGLLHFGKQNGNGNGTGVSPPCAMHQEVSTTLRRIEDKQILNSEKHEQHEKELRSGSQKFEKIQEDVGALREGVGILMDRSGGRPEAWRKN